MLILQVDIFSSFVSLCRTRLHVEFLIFWPDKKISEMKKVRIKPKQNEKKNKVKESITFLRQMSKAIKNENHEN